MSYTYGFDPIFSYDKDYAKMHRRYRRMLNKLCKNSSGNKLRNHLLKTNPADMDAAQPWAELTTKVLFSKLVPMFARRSAKFVTLTGQPSFNNVREALAFGLCKLHNIRETLSRTSLCKLEIRAERTYDNGRTDTFEPHFHFVILGSTARIRADLEQFVETNAYRPIVIQKLAEEQDLKRVLNYMSKITDLHTKSKVKGYWFKSKKSQTIDMQIEEFKFFLEHNVQLDDLFIATGELHYNRAYGFFLGTAEEFMAFRGAAALSKKSWEHCHPLSGFSMTEFYDSTPAPVAVKVRSRSPPNLTGTRSEGLFRSWA